MTNLTHKELLKSILVLKQKTEAWTLLNKMIIGVNKELLTRHLAAGSGSRWLMAAYLVIINMFQPRGAST